MKTTEADKTNTVQQKNQTKRKPFFTKEEEGGFFSKSNENKQSFFSPITIQPKLTIGKPNDKYEVEADAMADQVVQKLSEPKTTVANDYEGRSNNLQRKCSTCEEKEKLQQREEEVSENDLELQRKPIFESNAEQPETEVQTKPQNSSAFIQTKCASCEQEEKLQKKEEDQLESDEEIQTKINSSNSEIPPEEENIQTKSKESRDQTSSNLQSKLNSSKGGGGPLPKDTQSSMGSAFGADFSNVRIHTGSEAVQMNKELGAQAFTNGSDIYFNQGKYDTNSGSGKHLLAHELTHTIQQGKSIQTKKESGSNKKKYTQNGSPTIQRAWYNFDIPFTDYQFDPSIRGIKNAASITAEVAGDAAGWIKDKALAIFDKVKKLINKGKDWISKKWNALKTKVSSSFNIAKTIFNALVHFIKSPIAIISSAILNMDAESIQNSWSNVTSFVLKIWDNFHKMGMGLLKSVESVWKTISGYADGLFNSISSLTNNRFFSYLPSSLKKVITGLISTVRNLWNGIKAVWRTIFNKLKTLLIKRLKPLKNS